MSKHGLYLDKIRIIDKNTFSETKFTSKHKEFYIQFSDKLDINEIVKNKLDILSEEHEDVKTTIIKMKYINDVINVDLPLPKIATLSMLKLIIADILNLNVSSVEYNNIDEYMFESMYSLESYETNTFIGEAKIYVNIIPTTKPRNNNYNKIYMKELNKTLLYLKKSVDSFSTGISKRISPFITEINYVLYNPKLKIDIDICHLFNTHNTNTNYPKICIHSDKLNRYLNDYNTMRSYIKSNYATLRPFNELNKYRNSCMFICNKTLPGNYIRLYQLTFCENGLIIVCFKNINQTFNYSEVHEITHRWLKSNYKNILQSLYINESVYKLNFNYNDYEILDFTHNSIIEIQTKNKIHELNKITELDGFIINYITKSSFRCLTFQSYSTSSKMLLNLIQNAKINYSTTSLNLIYYNSVQINQQNKSITITINNSSSIENTNLLYELFINRINSFDVEKITNKLTSEDILIKARKIDPKIKIRLLKELDPVLFGNRYVKNNKNELELYDYSQLVQTNEQRPFPLTIDEYKILSKTNPDSVLNIENQANHERLYLLCPFENLSFINYHHFDKQKCIIKCTTKFTNVNQYEYCDESLKGISNTKSVVNKFTSNTITSFNPIIDTGRKCILPDELFNIFTNYVLLKCDNKLNIHVNIEMKYNSSPFIIERDENNKCYKIMTEFNEKTNNYVLVMLISGTNNYFVFVDSVNGSILKLNKDSTNNFIKQIIKISKYKNNIVQFISFYNKLFKAKIDETLNLLELNKKINKPKYNTTFITDRYAKFIIGINKNNVFYSTPIIFNTLTENIYPITEYMKNIDFRYPKYTFFNPNDIDMLYRDFTNKRIVGIKIYGQKLLIHETDISDIRTNIELVDIRSFILSILGFEEKQIRKTNLSNELININELLTSYLVLTINEYGEINEDNFNKILKHFLNPSKIIINYNDVFLSWRTSSIPKNKLFHINFNADNIVSVLYEKIKNDMTINYNTENEYLYKGNIY